MADTELETFKRDIDLRVYCAAQGYELDRRSSWGGSAVMREPRTDDKLIIKVDADGHFVYCSCRDNRDAGTVIDFIQHRRKLSLGEVRRELRAWLGRPSTALPVYEPLARTSKNRMKVETAFAETRPVDGHHFYLERERGITWELLASERFADAVRIDGHGNAVFPHFDHEGLCGFELRNYRFRGFASGGAKGLWSSRSLPEDDKLAICESAIDAMSYALLYTDQRTRYASIGGKPNPVQPELIRAAAARLPSGAQIIAAMDADGDGLALAEVVRAAVEQTGRADLRFRSEAPSGFKDWNDQLCRKASAAKRHRRRELALNAVT
jgi:Toprim-like/Protein of unknown function (DUF3991)